METISIMIESEDELQKLVDAYNRKAERVGQPERVSYRVTGDPIMETQDICDGSWSHPEILARRVVEVLPVEISFPDIIMPGGWEFAAVLDHTDDGNIIRGTGVEIPIRFRVAEPCCDHCNTLRDRKQTVVVKDSEGHFRQVGTTCLQEYTGLDPRALELLALREMIFVQDGKLNWGRASSETAIRGTLATARLVIRELQGGRYISKKAAEQENTHSTADLTALTLYSNAKEVEELREKLTEDDLQHADAVIEWIKDYPESDSYFYHNLKVLVKRGSVPTNMIGIVAGALAAHNRDLMRREAQPQYKNEVAGEIGERKTWKVTLMNRRDGEGNYGPWTMLQFMSREGYCIVTWTNPETQLATSINVGDEGTLTARIKDYDEFNGITQTVVTRAGISTRKEMAAAGGPDVERDPTKDAGYLEHAKARHGGLVVIYNSAERGLDHNGKYTVTCDAANESLSTDNLEVARAWMQNPTWCPHCCQELNRLDHKSS